MTTITQPQTGASTGATPYDQTERRWLWLLTDGAAVMVVGVLLTFALLPTFGQGWLWVTVLGGTLLGMVIGWTGRRLHANTALVAAMVVLAWFVFGTLLAMPSAGIGAVIPTGRSLGGLLTGPVEAPRAMLGVEPPIGETSNLLVVPLALAMLTGVLSASISLRTRRPQLAFLPGAAALLTAWWLGTSITYAPVWTGVLLVALVLCWTLYRREQLRRTLVSAPRRASLAALLVPAGIGALVLALTGAAAVLLGHRVQPELPRLTARAGVEPPLDLRRYASPLQTMRGITDNRLEESLLTVEGVPSETRIRLATLDSFDGLTYNVTNADSDPQSGDFRRVGARIQTTVQGSDAEITVQIDGLSGVWLPTVGQVRQVRFEQPSDRVATLSDHFYYNRTTSSGLVTSGLQRGDSYQLSAVVAAQPSDAEIAAMDAGTFRQPNLGAVPDVARDLAGQWSAGARTKGEVALKLQAALRTGYFSHGSEKEATSLPGHSSARIQTLLANPKQMIGDEEQFATTMAVMARLQGIPARVVYGFNAPPSGSGSLRGEDIGAWTELYLGDHWVMFNPTPDHNRVIDKPDKSQSQVVRPQVQNPPPDPKQLEQPPKDTNLDTSATDPPPQNRPIDWRRVGTWVAIIGLPLLLIVVPIVLVLGLKWRRRTLRRTATDPANRVAGAWAELVDRARDLRASPSPAGTRTEQAEALATRFPVMLEEADPIALARRADGMVFQPDPVDAEDAASFWVTMRAAHNGLRRSVGFWRWVRGALSTRSFRRYR